MASLPGAAPHRTHTWGDQEQEVSTRRRTDQTPLEGRSLEGSTDTTEATPADLEASQN